jgi:hypothetical protein
MFMHGTASAAGPNDKSARARGDAAIDKHYLAMNMELAESELTAAIQACGGNRCSPAVEATLRRDLAMVYVAGKKKGPAKQQMQQAIKLDPSLKLNPDLTTDELRTVYVQAGGGKAPAKAPATGAATAAPAANSPPVEDVVLEEEEPEFSDSEVESDAAKGPYKHWASGALQLDTMLHKQTKEACTAPDAYFCYNEDDERYGARGEPALSTDQGNTVPGGLALATIRLILGYDYHLLPSLVVGGRLGVAFRGAPVDDQGDSKGFMPVHLELRAQRLFSKTPFQAEAFTPYLGIAAGMAQVDSGVAIDVYQVDDPTRYELTGYKKTGKGFVGLSGGSYYLVNEHLAPFAELVFMQMLPVSAQVFAIRVGAAYGLDF